MKLQPLRPVKGNRQNKTYFAPANTVLLVVFLLLAIVACRPQGTLRQVPTRSTLGASFLGVPEPVSLPQLAENPFLYQNKYIRVSGDYLPPETFATCLRNVRGPAGRWFLSGENWQLEVSGYERVAPRLQPGTPMTIDGIFTYYEGPLGCGKGAERDKLWYLKVIHIEDPNPLPLLASGDGLVNLTGGLPGLAGSGTITATAPAFAAPVVSGTPPVEPEPAGDTPTPNLASPSATATDPAATEPADLTITDTPVAGTGTTVPTTTPISSPTPSPTPAPTMTPGGPPTAVPPSPTPTDENGYPPPGPIITPPPPNYP